jgi:cytochrome c peroxidase
MTTSGNQKKLSCSHEAMRNVRFCRAWMRLAMAVVITLIGVAFVPVAQTQTGSIITDTFKVAQGTSQNPPAPNSMKPEDVKVPAESPKYFGPVYRQALHSPQPLKAVTDGGFPAVINQREEYTNPSGRLGSYLPFGPVTTKQNAFFQSLGTNGRSCATCHQPPSGMSVSLKNINDRFTASNGTDPIFAPLDGADCPNKVPASATSGSLVGGLLGKGSDPRSAHKLILSRGVFRIFIPVPDDAQFTIKVLSDPTGCNFDPDYDQEIDSTGKLVQVISMFRRPLVSTNLAYVTTTRADTLTTTTTPPPTVVPNAAAVDPITHVALPTDPFSNKPESGNIMWDGREPTLQQQATDATLGHAQAKLPPSPAQVQQIVDFETQIYSAQGWGKGVSQVIDLTSAGTLAGPVYLFGLTPYSGIPSLPVGSPNPPPPAFPPTQTFTPTFFTYNAWQNPAASLSESAFRASVYRGQQIFSGTPLPDGSTRTFTIANVAGINNIPGIPPLTGGSCSSCHNQTSAGSDSFPAAQHDIGIGGDLVSFNGPAPSTDLPIFQITCTGGTSTAFNGSTVTTNDPGMALITGKCADIGRFSVAPLRALAAHPPYFSDGSAATLNDVVNFYNKRFSIGLSAQDQQDLVNFLSSL